MESTTRNRPIQQQNKTDSETSKSKPKAAGAADINAADAKNDAEQQLCTVPRYLDTAVIAAPTASKTQSEQLNSSTTVTPANSAASQSQSNSTKNSPNSAQTASNTANANAEAKTDGNTKNQPNPADAGKTAADDVSAKQPEKGKKDAENSQKAVDTVAKEAKGGGKGGAANAASTGGQNGNGVANGAPKGENQGDTNQASTSGSETAESFGGIATPSKEQETPKLAPLIIARTGYIRAPRVPYPPKESIKRSAEIRTRTGSPPEMHHAKIQQAVLRLVDAARDGQRQIVWRVGILAKDSRLNMDQLANEILGFVAGCIQRLEGAINKAKTEIGGILDTQIQYISSQKQLTDEALAKSQKDNETQVHSKLLNGSEELKQAHTEIQNEFAPYLAEAQANTKAVSIDGSAKHVAPPKGSEPAPAKADAAKSTDSAGAKPAAPAGPIGPKENLKIAKGSLSSTLDTMAQNALGLYHASRSRPVMEGRAEKTQTSLTKSAEAQATGLDAFKGQFTNYALRLVTPVASAEQKDKAGDAKQVVSELDKQRQKLAEAAGENGKSLLTRYQGVLRHLGIELGPKLKEGLNEAGAKAAKSFRDQGEATERMMQNTSASLAEGYPQVVARVAEMLPDNQFLDERELGPRLFSAWQSARKLPDQQYAAMAEQAAQALVQARAAQKKQVESIGESAEKGIQAVTDVVTATRFDFESFSFQVTGVMREGGWASITGATEYATRMAKDLVKTKGKTKGALNNLIGSFVGSLNGAIDNAASNYFAGVDDFKKSMTDEPKGAFAVIRKEINEDLSGRSKTLNDKLTKPDSDVTTGLVVLNVLTLGTTVAATAGYLAYMDADDDEIFAAIGSLQWPGQGGLEYYFNNNTPYGNLQNRINDCLSKDAAKNAIALFSSDAKTRSEGRLAAVEDSFGVFGLDADARESLLQGFAKSERDVADQTTVDKVSGELQDLWFSKDTTIRLNQAYLKGDYAAALSARMEASMNSARGKDSDAIFKSVKDIEGMAKKELAITGSASFIEPDQVQKLTDDAMKDFAWHQQNKNVDASKVDVKAARESIDLKTAHQTFVDAVTADQQVYVGDGQTIPVPVDKMVKDYVSEIITKGWESKDGQAARQAYEFKHAGGGLLGPSETDQVRFTQAFEDPKLAQLERRLKEHPEERDQILPQLKKVRAEHDEQMMRVLKRLHPEMSEKDIAAAGGPTKVMAAKSAELFAGNHFGGFRTEKDQAEDAQYATELITGGRASLAAGVRISTRGAGTNEELLSMTYAGRSKAEIAEARKVWQDKYGEDLDVMLGIKPRPFSAKEAAITALSPGLGMYLYGGEVSGDLAMELERSSKGEPENDQDYIELAALTYRQQRERGTGFLARITMSGSPDAKSLDEQQNKMASMLLKEAQARQAANANNPNASNVKLPDDPAAVFLADGSINPAIAALVFAPAPGSKGKPEDLQFLGDRSGLLNISGEVELAGKRYQAEIDRQESLMLSAISILAIIATVVLMAVGVGFVLAGVIVALGSGLATMAVKSGMRGERYGWEEAATDMAMTAIEVAAAGAGGALGGGLGKTGMLAEFGESLIAKFGRVGGAVVREAIVGGISSAARVAIQDETYKDGPGAAIGKIIGGGMKGAAISAVSAGVSESIGNGLNRRLSGAVENADQSLLAQLGKGAGPMGRNIIKEGVSSALGSIAGEATGILIEVNTGDYHGSLKDALKRMGEAGLRDLISASARGAVTSYHQANFNRLMEEARNSTQLSESDLKALHVAAKAAGEHQFDSPESLRKQIDVDRTLLAQLPPELRQHAASMDPNSLHQLTELLHQGELGQTSEKRREFFMELGARNPQLNTEALLRELEISSARLVPATKPEDFAAQQTHLQQVRGTLTAELSPAVRTALGDIPVHGLDQIPPSHLELAAKMLARGVFDPHQADSLLQAARAHNPELDAVSFLKNLHSAVQSASLAEQAQTRILAKQRATVLRDIPPEAHGLFAHMPDESIGQLKNMLDQGHAGSPELQAALLKQAQAFNPDLDSHQFEQVLEQAAENAVARQSAERLVQREARQQRMSNVPEEVRGTLSVLPDSALIELHLRQMEGAISPAERLSLEHAALKENPQLDLASFHKALDQAIEHGAPIRSTANEQQQMSREMLAAVPESQRHLVQDVPILVMADADFASFTRSAKGDAVTLMVNGRAVVVMREGAEPHVLREEGIHALQSKDPKWAAHMGSLEESHLGQWDKLPLEQQMVLYRNKLELEIDAHQRLTENLHAELQQAASEGKSAEEIDTLRSRIALAEQAHSNLTNRMREVDAISPMQRHLMDAGMAVRPQWLDQPARLFGKRAEEVSGKQKPLAKLLDEFMGTDTSEDTRKKYERLTRDMDVKQLNALAALGMEPDQMRRVLISHDKQHKDATYELIAHLQDIHKALPKGMAAEVLNKIVSSNNFAELAPHLSAIASKADTPEIAHALVKSVAELAKFHVAAAKNLSEYVAAADAKQQSELISLLGDISSSGHGKLFEVMGEISAKFATMKLDENEAHSFTAALIAESLHSSIKQPVDLINRAQLLLNAVHSMPNSPERSAILNHIIQGMTKGGDLREQALDIRAASRDVGADGKLSKATLERFAENIAKGEPMSGGDAFRLHIEDCVSKWPSFEAEHPHFAKLLDSVAPKLSPQDKAVLAEMEPWFEHLINPKKADPTHTEPSRKPLTVAEQKALLQKLIDTGLQGNSGVNNADTLRHVMGEIRAEVVSARQEPDFNVEVRNAMKEMGFGTALIKATSQDFDARLERDRKAGLTTPEVHLENLVRQRIEYEHLVDTAKQIAKSRFPNAADEPQLRALYNELTAGLKQKITETTGEILATHALMSKPQFKGYSLLRGFEPGTGFDQVWVKLNNKGELEHILIVEAKGPDAKLGKPAKGAQMSPEWVAKTVQEMLAKNEKLQTEIARHNVKEETLKPDQRRGPLLGAEAQLREMIHQTDILQQGLLGNVPISGVVVQSNKDGTDYKVAAAPGAKGAAFRYDPAAIRAEFKFHYTDTEINKILLEGRKLKLSDDQIFSFMLDNVRNYKLKVGEIVDLMRDLHK